MHAIKVLKEDHARLSELLEKAKNAPGVDPRLFEKLERDLTVHTLAEDNVFLPQVEDAIRDSRRTTRAFFADGADGLSGADEAIAAAYENHRAVRQLLARAPDEIEELASLMERQVEIEESLYPQATKVLEEEDFERIGDLIEHCKWQVRGLAQARLASSSSFRP